MSKNVVHSYLSSLKVLFRGPSAAVGVFSVTHNVPAKFAVQMRRSRHEPAYLHLEAAARNQCQSAFVKC